MDCRHKTDVVEWVNAPHAVVSQRPTSAQSCSPAIIGLAGTLLIHASAIQSLFFTNHSHKVHPTEILEPAGSGVNTKPDSVENLVLIDLPSTVNTPDRITVSVAAIRVVNKVAVAIPVDPDPPVLAGIEALTLGDQEESGAVSASGDGEDRARLHGIYTGQIQARIDRIWRRPRTPISERASSATTDESFRCQVQIVQDISGDVQEVLLPRCNGSPAWQRSLVLAIQQASPLPAPPSAKVFSQSITLNFVGLAYVAGGPDDDYENPPSKAAQIPLALPANYPTPLSTETAPMLPPSVSN